MDIYWYGQSCIKIKGKTAAAVFDPFDPDYTGLKLPKDLACDFALITHDHKDHNNKAVIPQDAVIISGPGEYEIKGVAVTGVHVDHDESGGAERGKNTIYNLSIDGLNIIHLGDLGHKLTEEQVEEIGKADILFIPVGGVYTIDSKQATEVVAQLEPRLVIPIHYRLPGLKFPLEDVENFLKEMGVEKTEPQSKLTITKDKLPEEPEIFVISKS
jgi:L-ascorbate metabolism protein UlaG (beta-lactamase superfamily)